MKFIDEGHASSSGPREPDFHMRNTTRVQRLELLSEIARRPTLRTQRIEPFYRWDKPGKPFYDDMRNTHRTQRIEPFYDDMRSQHSQNTHRTQRIEPFYDDMRNTHRTQRIEPFYDDMRNTHRTQRAATRVP
jgi:ribosomal protein L20A (L18A)